MEMTRDNEVENDETMEISSDEEDERETSNVAPAPKFRWLSGKVFVPEKCGCFFHHEATDCFDSIENDDGVSIKTAISVYLEVLLGGLRAARQLLDAILSSVTIRPVPTSGRKVMFSMTELLGMELRGKPNSGKRLCNDPNVDGHWVVSQGEILTGKINFYDFSRQLGEEGIAQFFFFKDDGEEVDVVVKVCSVSIHGYLNHPRETWLSLWSIKSAYEKEKSAGKEKWDLFNVLFAADKAANGLVIIMADLSMDYKVLTPEQDDLPFHVLWSAFQDLVLRILLPLADINIIHPNLRPGWDVTANILITREIPCPRNTPAIQIIDFESLVNNDDWNPPYCASPHKYIRRRRNWSPYTFVWWQCVTTAFAWKMKRKQIDMAKIDMHRMILDDTSVWSIMLGKEFCVLAKEVDMSRGHVEGCLERLRVILCDQIEA